MLKYLSKISLKWLEENEYELAKYRATLLQFLYAAKTVVVYLPDMNVHECTAHKSMCLLYFSAFLERVIPL